MLNSKKFKSILCLNGDLPPRDFFQWDLPIVAADGALHALLARHINPDMVIGDFDSINQALLTLHPHQHIPDQSSTDFEKCLAYLKARELLPAIILGVQGGVIDHVLHNINLFTQTDSIFYAPPIIGFTVKSGQVEHLEAPLGTKISLFGMPSAVVESQGLKWELHHASLVFPGQNSCFNRFNQASVTITVKEGCLLVLLYEAPVIDAGW